jgi:hypothetical protein
MILGLAVGIFFLYLALREVRWSEVIAVLRRTDRHYLWLAFVVTLINLALKSMRWKFLLRPSGASVKTVVVSASFIAAQLLNSLVPVRVGEISRILVIGGRGADHAFVLGTLIGEKYLDILAYAILIGLLLVWVPLPTWMDDTVSALIILSLVISLALFLVLLLRERLLRAVLKFSQRFSLRVQPVIMKNFQSGLASLAVFQNFTNLTILALTTGLIWITALMTNQLVLIALEINVPPEAALLSLVAIVVGFSLPSLPGKIGVFEFACILSLGFFGLDHSAGLSYGILLHIVVYLPILILGLASLWYLEFKGLQTAVD